MNVSVIKPVRLNALTEQLAKNFKPKARASRTPSFLLVGSRAGVTHADMLAFVRGVAEAHIKAPEVAQYRILRDDNDKERFYFEIHEGGPCLSILDKLLATLSPPEAEDEDPVSIKIALTDGFYAVVEKPYSELYSIIYPPLTAEELEAQEDSGVVVNDLPEPIANYLNEDIGLKRLYPDYQVATPIGWACLIGSAASFLLAGSVYVLMSSGILKDDLMLAQARIGLVSVVKDNPVWQLETAKQQALAQGDMIHVLRKDKKNWSWELRTPTIEEVIDSVNKDDQALAKQANAMKPAKPIQAEASVVEPVVLPDATPATEAPSAVPVAQELSNAAVAVTPSPEELEARRQAREARIKELREQALQRGDTAAKLTPAQQEVRNKLRQQQSSPEASSPPDREAAKAAMQERLKSMTPEQRAAIQARRAEIRKKPEAGNPGATAAQPASVAK